MNLEIEPSNEEGGITEDVNYYDGSKPKTTMELVAWFDKDG